MPVGVIAWTTYQFILYCIQIIIKIHMPTIARNALW